MSYSVFAKYYDELTKNISYPKRAEYFNQIINKFSTNQEKPILLDLACGTGSLSLELSKIGYDVIGVDSSPEMLSEAMQKRAEMEMQDVLFLCQEMDQLDLYGTIDVAVCSLDSLNHIVNLKTLQNVFKKVSLFLNPNGLFVFDVNTIYKHSEILGNNIFIYDCENVYCTWQNKYCTENHIVEINLDFFEYSRESDSYYRSSESFSERAYSMEELNSMLVNSGFELVAQYADDSFDCVKPDTQRIICVAVKKNK